MTKILTTTRHLLTAGILLFGASEVLQAAPRLRQANCPQQGNWCATSRGGEQNCRDCCQSEASICTTTLEDDQLPGDVQGCICA
jgi:hypothetical protein